VNLNFLFTYWALHRTTPEGARALQMSLHTLKMMAHGGIHDHIGQVGGEPWGESTAVCRWSAMVTSVCSSQGFHRYSTDRHWHVPHFEKMLYDQGQLAVVYSRAFQVWLWAPAGLGLPIGGHRALPCSPSVALLVQAGVLFRSVMLALGALHLPCV